MLFLLGLIKSDHTVSLRKMCDVSIADRSWKARGEDRVEPMREGKRRGKSVGGQDSLVVVFLLFLDLSCRSVDSPARFLTFGVSPPMSHAP